MQHDLFGDAEPDQKKASHGAFKPPPEFVAKMRAELQETLRLAQQATLLPWPDLTQTTLAELRFNSIAGWLPKGEADALRAAFDAEMTRLYEAEDNLRAGGSEGG